MRAHRFLCILCAIALLGSTLPTALAADMAPVIYTDAAQITHKEAVAALTELGVMSGNEAGEFCPKDPVTRATAAKLVATMLTGGKELSYRESSGPSFTDTQGHWAEPYIDYCKAIGLIDGRGDGSFGPDESVTGTEFMKMALLALGYDKKICRLTGSQWDMHTIHESAGICDPSLYEGLLGREDFLEIEPLTREFAAQILYNMLDNAIMETNLYVSQLPEEITLYHEFKEEPSGLLVFSHRSIRLNDEILGELAPKKDENGQTISFRSLYFPGKELEKAPAQPES